MINSKWFPFLVWFPRLGFKSWSIDKQRLLNEPFNKTTEIENVWVDNCFPAVFHRSLRKSLSAINYSTSEINWKLYSLFPRDSFINFPVLIETSETYTIFFLFLLETCHPYEPFKCPSDGNCISIQYLCDGAPDCSDGYDEDMRLCTAGKLLTMITFWHFHHFYRAVSNCWVTLEARVYQYEHEWHQWFSEENHCTGEKKEKDTFQKLKFNCSGIWGFCLRSLRVCVFFFFWILRVWCDGKK